MMPARMKVNTKRGVGRPRDPQKNAVKNHEIAKRPYCRKNTDASKTKSAELSRSSKETENILTFPLLKTIDRDQMLPHYSAILHRSLEEGVGMDDLDSLQLELEALLSAVVVRSRVISKEINTLSNAEEKQKRGKLGNRSLHGSSKRGNVCDKPKKVKNSKTKDLGKTPVSIKFTKVKSLPASSSSSNNISLPEYETQKTVKHDSPRLIHSRYDLPNKFWASVDSYCTDVTRDDIRFLEELSKECENGEEYQKIPPLGRHYSLRWADEDLKSEQEEGHGEMKGPGKNSQLDSQTLLKKGEKACEVSTVCPLTQRLVSSLMENAKIYNDSKLDSKSSGGENITPRSGLFRSFVANNPVGFERRVCKELEEQGNFENDQSKESDDEILQEIKRCQNELLTINDYNNMHLKRLINLSEVQITRQELKRKLQQIDNEVMEHYRTVVAAKQKKTVLTKTEQDVCWKVLKEREALLKMLD